jgi:porphobilinogen deaminase
VDDQTPLPVSPGAIKIACRVRRREVNETLSSVQRRIEFHVVNQVKSVLRWLQYGCMRHHPTLW